MIRLKLPAGWSPTWGSLAASSILEESKEVYPLRRRHVAGHLGHSRPPGVGRPSLHPGDTGEGAGAGRGQEVRGCCRPPAIARCPCSMPLLWPITEQTGSSLWRPDSPVHPISARCASALAKVILVEQPYAVLFGSTANGRDLASRIAANLALGLTGDCIDLAINDDGELVQYKPALGRQRGCSHPVQDHPLHGDPQAGPAKPHRTYPRGGAHGGGAGRASL